MYQASPNERGVSSVIGVVLVVTITVILAAVIGALVLDFGDSGREPGPNTALAFSEGTDHYDPAATSPQDMFVIEFSAGEELELRTLKVTLRNVSSNAFLLTWDGRTGFDASTSNGAIDDWNVTLKGNNVTAGASADDTMDAGDMMKLTAENASNIDGDGTDQDYTIVITHKETDSTVARTTIRLT